jgi:cell wall-associated NlpC family hydrolase
MPFDRPLFIFTASLLMLFALLGPPPALAEEPVVIQPPIVIQPPLRVSFIDRATTTMQDVLDQATDLLGMPYQWGGSSPGLGFDCSGFVTHVFRVGLGLTLPRTAKAMSKEGQAVIKDDLQPGDLVFFNTMRRAFSHVGIYLGNNQFIHAPRSGEKVRVDNLDDNYWIRHFNGARRVSLE